MYCFVSHAFYLNSSKTQTSQNLSQFLINQRHARLLILITHFHL
uniref:Uncharacterized protein n=1 Tax=Anguilla anguilla TaxID=7936 RepID=A0A0E9QXM4_ANGAN